MMIIRFSYFAAVHPAGPGGWDSSPWELYPIFRQTHITLKKKRWVVYPIIIEKSPFIGEFPIISDFICRTHKQNSQENRRKSDASVGRPS